MKFPWTKKNQDPVTGTLPGVFPSDPPPVSGALADHVGQVGQGSQGSKGEGGWERRAILDLAASGLKEQRAARRWTTVFRMGVLVYLFGLLAFAAWPKLMASLSEDDSARSVAVIDVVGVIDSKGRASAERINRALRRAFKEPGTVGVILRIDSPGGSPVQSAMIYDEVRRLRAKHKDIPLHAVIEDLGASGGYYVAASADRIHVSEASLVGSIGVIMNGFGFTGTMEKLGIERRMITSGENKGFLDPFSPVSPEQIEHAKGFLSEVHEQFIAAVKKGRGDRLKDDPKLFSGLVWTGASAVRLGLADGLGTVESVARDVLKADRIVDYSEQDTVLDRLSKKFGVGISEGMGSMLGMTQTPLR